MTVTLHRLLTESKHIALLGTVAALALPAAASAAQNDGHAPRERLRAEAPKVPGASAAIGIGDAVAVDGPLLDPVDRYSGLIVRRTTKAAHRHKVQARSSAKARGPRRRGTVRSTCPAG